MTFAPRDLSAQSVWRLRLRACCTFSVVAVCAACTALPQIGDRDRPDQDKAQLESIIKWLEDKNVCPGGYTIAKRENVVRDEKDARFSYQVMCNTATEKS